MKAVMQPGGKDRDQPRCGTVGKERRFGLRRSSVCPTLVGMQIGSWQLSEEYKIEDNMPT